MKTKQILISAMLCLLLGATAWGQTSYEPFNYTVPGNIGGNTSGSGTVNNNWTTHSNSQVGTIDVIAGSLSYTGLQASTGNKVYVPGSNGTVPRDVNTPISIGTPTVAYWSALVNIVDNTQLGTTGDYFMGFGATAGSSVTVFGGRVGIKSSGTGFRFTITNASSGTPTLTDNGSDLSFGTTYLIVVKYDKSASPTVATMWVNPSSLGGTEPAGGVTNNSGTGAFAAFASMFIRNGSGTPKAYYDEIRAGTTWASVTPASAVPPTISGFSPTSGAVGASVTVNGTDLSGATSLSFNGTNATILTNTSTQITTTVPLGATTGVISVTTPGGTANSATSFTVIPAPTITGFSPTSGAVGAGVTIDGTDLSGATSVTFNGTSATILTNTATQITTTVPVGAGTGPISVTTPGGTAISSTIFTVVGAPTITGFTPSSGVIGASVTIDGTNLTGATSLTFNGTSATILTNTATEITTTVPAGAKTGAISVVTPGGTATSATNFTVVLAPSITGFTPTSGAVGSAVTINGTDLTGATALSFNGTNASILTNTATQITTTVPAGATSGAISVTTPGGTGTSGTNFIVLGSVVTSVANGNWSAGATWDQGVKPVPTQTVIINHTVTLTATDTAAAVTVNAGGVLDIATFKLGLAGTYTLSANAEGRQGAFNPIPGGGITPWNFNASSTYTVNGSATGFSIGSAAGITFGNLNWASSANATPPVGVAVMGNLVKSNTGELRGGTGTTSRVVVVHGNVIVNGGILYGTNSTSPSTGGFDIDGDLIVNTAGTLAMNRFSGPSTISVGGNLLVNDTAKVIAGIGSGSSHLYFKGTGASNFDPGVVDTNAFMNIGIAPGRTVTLLNHDVNIRSTYTFSDSGTLNLGVRSVKGPGSFALVAGGTLVIGSPDGITASAALGNVQVVGTRTYNPAADFCYNGSAAQVTGDGLPSSVNNLTVDNIAGVSLSGATTVGGILSLANGKLIPGVNLFSLGTSGSVNRTNGYVAGVFRKPVAAGVAPFIVFEIGDASNYTPVVVGTLFNVSVAGSLTASTTTGANPNLATSGLNTSKKLNRYYTLTNEGTTFDGPFLAIFNFVAGDVDAGANTANFVVKKFDNGTWSSPTTANPLATSIQATGMTSFSDFAIGEPAVPQITTTQMNNGWNLVSVPRVPPSYATAALFPTAVSGSVNSFVTGTYTQPSTLVNGEGYWAFYSAAGNNTIAGTALSSGSVTVATGNRWVLIGSVTSSVPVSSLTSNPPGAIVPSTLYGWDGSIYSAPSTLEPGKGYWVFVSAPCTLTVSSGSVRPAGPTVKSGSDASRPSVKNTKDVPKQGQSPAGN
jgi:hypothetical protein